MRFRSPFNSGCRTTILAHDSPASQARARRSSTGLLSRSRSDRSLAKPSNDLPGKFTKEMQAGLYHGRLLSKTNINLSKLFEKAIYEPED